MINHQKSLLTCLHFKCVGVLLLYGVCELEASIAAVVSLGIFSQNVGEEQVTVQAHWHPPVLCYRHNDCGEKENRIQTHLFNLIWCAIADRQQTKWWCSRWVWKSQRHDYHLQAGNITRLSKHVTWGKRSSVEECETKMRLQNWSVTSLDLIMCVLETV